VTRWTGDELERIGAAQELVLTAGRVSVPIWVVRVDDELYVRSWRGERAAWYRAVRRDGTARIDAGGVERDVRLERDGTADDRVDDAYLGKYTRSSYTAAMVAPDARATTLRLEPA
jgi:hypothetical protein